MGVVLIHLTINVVGLLFVERMNSAKLTAMGVIFIGANIFRKLYVFKN
jgi:hypothetical protein